MENLVLKEIFLLSKKDGKARSFKLKKGTNLILGKNDTGKSSLIKSIFHTFGGDIKFHERWDASRVITVVHFSFKGSKFYILRDNKLFGIFDNEYQIIDSYVGIKELSQFISNKFSFKLKLKQNFDHEIKQATPAFLYLPYYIDQDKGWTETFKSFEGLGQFTRWKKEFLDFHIGYKPSRYYELSAKVEVSKIAKKELLNEKEIITKSSEKLKKKLKVGNFNINIEEYSKEINELLVKINELNTIENTYRKNIKALRYEEHSINEHVSSAKNMLTNLEKDYNFVIKKMDQEGVDCPLCGTHFKNSFYNKYSLLEDAEDCKLLIREGIGELHEIREKISKLTTKFNKNNKYTRGLQKILNKKKRNLKLNDYIKTEARAELHRAIEKQFNKLALKLDKLTLKIDKNEEKKKKFLSRERKKEMNEFYNGEMEKSLRILNVLGLSFKAYKNLPTVVRETGSDTPRAMLAYSYSVLATIFEFSPSIRLPIIVDSPNQQDQDEKNAKKLIDFTVNNRPKNSQLILGSVSLHEAEVDGHTIELTEKWSLLNKENFEVINSFVSSLLNKTIDHAEIKTIKT